jgi:Tfp pilus assembly protein PilO
MRTRSWTHPLVWHAGALAVVVVGILLSWLLAYRPVRQTLVAERSRLAAWRQEVEQTEVMIEAAGGEAAWMARQQARLSAIARQLPSSRQMPEVLDQLLNQVAASRLTVRNVTQGNLEPVTDAQGQPLRLEEAACLSLPVTVTAEGTFHQALEFLDRITTEEAAMLITVQHVDLRRTQGADATLALSVQLALYATDR